LNLVARQHIRVAHAIGKANARITKSIVQQVDDAVAGYARNFRELVDTEQTMKQMIGRIRQFVVSEDGPTAVEYAVLMGLIIVALVTVVKNLAGSVSTTFSQVSSTLGASS
jgi:pilus assembly protein Flp/PilA